MTLTDLNWVTISSLATAAGTLVLAVATFASVRSANHAARVAERSFRVALRPILAPSKLDDTKQRVMFGDRHWVLLYGGQAVVEVIDEVIYLAMMVRNVGNGIGIIESWLPYDHLALSTDGFGALSDYRAQTRSLWIAPGDVAFWQGALREPGDPMLEAMAAAIEEGEVAVNLLYRDHEGGQQTISRFSFVRDEDGERWWASLSRHVSVVDGLATP
jgi:hypothetical protein